MEIKDFKIKVVPWIYSNDFFITKIKKRGDWLWTTMRVAEEDVLSNNWHYNKRIRRATEYNKKEIMTMFNCWEDYLKYDKKEREFIIKRQNEVDTERQQKKND